MAKFTTYGHTFSMPDKYAAGHAVNDAEAGVLNQQMAEFTSHRLRAGILGDLKKGDSPSEEQIAKANAFIESFAQRFEFDMPREGGRASMSPLEKLCAELAAIEVDRSLEKAGLRVGKRAQSAKTNEAGEETAAAVPEESGEGIYPASKYRAKISEVAQFPAIIARAQKMLKQREQDTGVEVAL